MSMRLTLLNVLLVAVGLPLVQNESPALTGHAAALYRQAQGGHFYADAAKLKPTITATSDGQSFVVVWTPKDEPSSWIVSLHGTQGFATDELALWYPTVKSRGIGLICVQWWLGEGDTTPSYYSPAQAAKEIDLALARVHARPGHVMLHGFSRGSTNTFALAAIDAGRGSKYFSLVVAESGGVALDYPPTRAILDGSFGARPLAGTRWITAAGAREPEPDRNGIPGMRRTADWLRAQGATVVDAIEDKNEGHGPIGRSTKNAKRVVDAFLAR